jgi:hypothetical protein
MPDEHKTDTSDQALLPMGGRACGEETAAMLLSEGISDPSVIGHLVNFIRITPSPSSPQISKKKNILHVITRHS